MTDWTHHIELHGTHLKNLARGERLDFDLAPESDEERTLIRLQVVGGTSGVDYVEGYGKRWVLLPERVFAQIRQGGSFAWKPEIPVDGVDTVLVSSAD